MQNVSSPGQTQRKAKSINLEANILAEWAQATSKLQHQIKTRALLLGAIVVVALAIIPPLRQSATQAAAAATAARNRNAKAARASDDMARQTKASQPKEREAKMLAADRNDLDVLLGNLTLVINSAPTSVVFDSIQSEVSNAELTITCKSQAESYEAGQVFSEAAGKGPNVAYAVQASAMKSVTLAPDGLAFDFIKKVRLEP